MNLLFVADGPRDEVTLPPLVERILGRKVTGPFSAWPRLHDESKKTGYGKQLRFALLKAVDAEHQGIVAVVDNDKDRHGNRIRDLRAARIKARHAGTLLPVAFGCAVPHVEAWLLDDPHAVRQTLVDSQLQVPTVRKTASPKRTLHDLIQAATDERELELLRQIAARLDPARCQHSDETGFADFAQDCQEEFKAL